MVRTFENVTVVGAGTMGSGIALVLANAGINVRLVDIKQEFIDKGMERIKKFIDGSIKRGKITEEKAQETLNRIKTYLDLKEALNGVDLIIEAIIEDVEAKKSLFKQLDEICDPEVIFASNTSAISITELASVTKRGDKVLGMHFFNPPPLMKLVEIVKGKETSDEVVEEIIRLCEKLGKTAVPSNEAPGFIVNRLLWQFLNEAYKLLEQGVATKEDIDTAVKLGLNHPMGPFELSDYIGLDVMLYIGNYIAQKLGKEYKPAKILVDMVEKGHLGRKTKKGFYEY